MFVQARFASDVSYSETLFGTYNAEDDYNTETGYRFVGLYAYNPRYTQREIDVNTQETIDELNGNCDFAFPMLAELSACDFTGYAYVPGFGCESYGLAETGENYGFSNYPDAASTQYLLTSICVREFTLFGVSSTAATASALENALAAHGYTGTTTDTALYMRKFGVSIVLSYAQETGWTLSVNVRATNDTGIVY